MELLKAALGTIALLGRDLWAKHNKAKITFKVATLNHTLELSGAHTHVPLALCSSVRVASPLP